MLEFCVPMRDRHGESPLRSLEHDLHRPVAYAILPIFAFANAGIAFAGMSWSDVAEPVTLGIVSGLVLGKPLGIMFFVGIAVLLGADQLPKGTTWTQVVGVSCACGIGFTMSLFIAGLAFEHGSGDYFSGDRLGIVIGSLTKDLAGDAFRYTDLGVHQLKGIAPLLVAQRGHRSGEVLPRVCGFDC